MGLSFAQALGGAGQDFMKARESKLGEEQTAAELALKQTTAARQLALQMKQLQIEQARAMWEKARAEQDAQRLINAGWSKVGTDTQNPDGTWTSNWYNPSTGEHKEFKQGTPKAVAIQDTKGDQALDLEKLRNKDKLEQIAASGRWHMRWAALAAQGKLKKEDWNVLKTDPGYMQSVFDMKSAIAERNMILSRMYNPTNPPTAEQMTQLNQQLTGVEQRLQKASTNAEQVRNRIRFGVSGAASGISGLVDSVRGETGPPRPPGTPADYVYRKNGSKGEGYYKPGTN